MNTVDAIMIIEGVEPEQYEGHITDAWQHLIDTAQVWSLQGWYGRTATRLIEEGICNAPEWADKETTQ